MKSSPIPTPAGGPEGVVPARLTSIDAMRGIAAMAVVFHHLQHNTVLEPVLRSLYPGAVERFFQLGARGVHVFFVLSGFVLLYSLRSIPLDGTQSGRFILRRQARLDPPYWTMIVVGVLMLAAEKAIGTDVAIPGFGDILLNFTYLQVITGAQQVIGVAWTLAIEIQFYLFLMLVLYVLRRVARNTAEPAGWPHGVTTVLFVTGAASALLHRFHSTTEPFFGVFWMYFALGGLVCLAWAKRSAWWWPLGLGVWSVAVTLPSTRALEPALIGVGTAAVVAIGVTVGASWRVWHHPVLGYLGLRSYSIYLVHLPILSAIMRTGFKLTDTSKAGAALWAVVSIVATLAAAEVLHRVVERPSLEFAAAAKRDGWRGVTECFRALRTRRTATPTVQPGGSQAR